MAEDLDNLYAAYTIVWLFVFIFLYRIYLGQKAITRDIETLTELARDRLEEADDDDTLDETTEPASTGTADDGDEDITDASE